MDKPRILIIEDDEDVRTQMKWALNADYDVHLAEDRSTALQVLQREKPAVVTLDLGLPPSPSDTREGFSLIGFVADGSSSQGAGDHRPASKRKRHAGHWPRRFRFLFQTRKHR